MTLPFGAEPSDLGEFMLGRVAVTPILLESDGRIDNNTENWTPAHVAEVERNIRDGLQWWTELLATKSSLHTLDWVIDTTYINNRPATPYEPINRISNNFSLWVGQFLTDAGYASSNDLATNIRSFNQVQRAKLNTDWSFTIFVVNSTNDVDGSFAPGGSFSRAFAFAGGLFQVIPSTRPASTYAHETGHMFWARDEYAGGGNFFQKRGYYDSQNLNATDLNPNPNFVQAPSIMSAGSNLEFAYENLVTSPHTLAQLGWVDSDGDQIFDVLDVPLDLQGTGRISTNGQRYQFVGTASAKALPNRNSAGNQNDITLNKINRIQYRINGGNWIDYSTHNDYTLNLNLDIPLGSVTTGTIEIRALNNQFGIASNLFTGSIGAAPAITTAAGIQGFAWEDSDENGTWTRNESGLVGVTVAVVDQLGVPLNLQRRLEPDDFPPGEIGTTQSGLRVDVIGMSTNGRVHSAADPAATTGSRIFKPVALNGTVLDFFRGIDQQLRIRFDNATSFASIDAIANSDNARVRLDAYDSNDNLISRDEQRDLAIGQRVTLEVGSQERRISYVIARAFGGTLAKFDNFTYGSPTTTRTASDGSFRLPYIPAGSYNIRIVQSPAVSGTSTPIGGVHTVSIGSNQTIANLNFGVILSESPWLNPNLPEDIDNDRVVSPLDVLALINEINAGGARPLDGSGLSYPPYFDPNGDRSLDALDVLMVINYINANPNGPAGEYAGEEIQSQELLSSFVFDIQNSTIQTRIIAISGISLEMVRENELDLYQCNHDHSNADSFTASHTAAVVTPAITAPTPTRIIEDVFAKLGESCCCPSCASSGEGEGIVDLPMDPTANCTKNNFV
ncbi:MAG: dockerin type I domain-containing protein [Pirellula sp.]|jgi:hypothetical protein